MRIRDRMQGVFGGAKRFGAICIWFFVLGSCVVLFSCAPQETTETKTQPKSGTAKAASPGSATHVAEGKPAKTPETGSAKRPVAKPGTTPAGDSPQAPASPRTSPASEGRKTSADEALENLPETIERTTYVFDLYELKQKAENAAKAKKETLPEDIVQKFEAKQKELASAIGPRPEWKMIPELDLLAFDLAQIGPEKLRTYYLVKVNEPIANDIRFYPLASKDPNFRAPGEPVNQDWGFFVSNLPGVPRNDTWKPDEYYILAYDVDAEPAPYRFNLRLKLRIAPGGGPGVPDASRDVGDNVDLGWYAPNEARK